MWHKICLNLSFKCPQLLLFLHICGCLIPGDFRDVLFAQKSRKAKMWHIWSDAHKITHYWETHLKFKRQAILTQIRCYITFFFFWKMRISSMMSNHGPNLQTSSMSVFSICPLPQFPSNGLRGGSSPHSVSVGRTKLFRERFSRLCFLPHKSHRSVRLQFTGNVIKYFSCFCPRLSMTITMWHALQVQTSPAVHQSCRHRFTRGITFI